LDSLRGDRIVLTRTDSPAWDVTLRFASGSELVIFGDDSPTAAHHGAHLVVFTPRDIVSIDDRLIFEWEPRQPEGAPTGELPPSGKRRWPVDLPLDWEPPEPERPPLPDLDELELRDKRVDALRHALERFRGQTCWAVGMLGEYGADFVLHCGDKIARLAPIPMDQDSRSQPTVGGTSRLRTMGTPWRLQTSSEVIVSYWDDESPGGRAMTCLQELVGDVVIAATAKPPAWDAIVLFASGRSLILFPSSGPWQSNYADYIVGADDREIVIHDGGRLARIKRTYGG
jgi:hypothetical protein